MKTLITLTLDQLSEQERKDLEYLFADALGEFCRVREPVVSYVLNRYSPEAVHEAKDKIAEVERRVALAKKLKLAAHDMQLKDEFVAGEVLAGPAKGKVVKTVRYQLPDGEVVLEEPYHFRRLHAVDETLVLGSVEYVVLQSSVDDQGCHQVTLQDTLDHDHGTY